jgi:hypothetical protein
LGYGVLPILKSNINRNCEDLTAKGGGINNIYAREGGTIEEQFVRQLKTLEAGLFPRIFVL